MSDHLPECADAPDVPMEILMSKCDCAALRACEQRVRGDWEPWCNEVSYDAGVQAARDAVAALRLDDYAADALAAIDALREPPHVDPCDCDRCRAAALRGEA